MFYNTFYQYKEQQTIINHYFVLCSLFGAALIQQLFPAAYDFSPQRLSYFAFFNTLITKWRFIPQPK